MEIIPKKKTHYDFNGNVQTIWLSKSSNSEIIEKKILGCIENYDLDEITLEYVMTNQTLK